MTHRDVHYLHVSYSTTVRMRFPRGSRCGETLLVLLYAA
jgi:hypothetical protein